MYNTAQTQVDVFTRVFAMVNITTPVMCLSAQNDCIYFEHALNEYLHSCLC